MQYSRYNIIVPSGAKVFIYNSKTDYFVQVEQQLAELFNHCKEKPEQLKNKAPDFYNHLHEHGFIVNDNTNEAQQLIKEWETKDACEDVMHVTINPTLNCNLRCWYCYEEHHAHTLMSENVIKSVFNLFKESLKQIQSIQFIFLWGRTITVFQQRSETTIKQFSTTQTSICKNFTAFYNKLNTIR